MDTDANFTKARLSYRALKATVTRVEKLATSRDAKIAADAERQLKDLRKRMAALVDGHPGCEQVAAKKRPERDEQGKIEVDRGAVLDRLAQCDDLIVGQVARILASHASRKAAGEAAKLIDDAELAAKVEIKESDVTVSETGKALVVVPAAKPARGDSKRKAA